MATAGRTRWRWCSAPIRAGSRIRPSNDEVRKEQKMRVSSAARIKGKHCGGRTNETPAEGTFLRKVWDLLQENKGKHTLKPKYIPTRDWGNATRDLRDFYGLDIRKGILVGEWFGRVYVDYLAQELEKESGGSGRTRPTHYRSDAPDFHSDHSVGDHSH